MAGQRSQPLYFNNRDQPVLAFIDTGKNYSEHSISTSLATISFEDATPFASYLPGKVKTPTRVTIGHLPSGDTSITNPSWNANT